MRTSIDLPDDLLAQAQRFAAESGRTLGAIVEDALRELLAKRRPRGNRPPTSLTTFGRSGLRPGVDLDDSAGLLDLRDTPGDPDPR